jgi:hypothetical protein
MRSESQCCKKYLKLQSDTVISPKVAFLIGSFYELFECECNTLFFSFSEEYDIEELKAVFDNFTLGGHHHHADGGEPPEAGASKQ